MKQFTSKTPDSRVVIRCKCRNSKSQQHTFWEETNENISKIPKKIQENVLHLPRFTNNNYLQLDEIPPRRFTRKPPT